jgi:hypothetical protein
MTIYEFEVGGDSFPASYADDERAIKGAYNRARTSNAPVRVYRDGALLVSAPVPRRRRLSTPEHRRDELRAELLMLQARVAGIEAELAALDHHEAETP